MPPSFSSLNFEESVLDYRCEISSSNCWLVKIYLSQEKKCFVLTSAHLNAEFWFCRSFSVSYFQYGYAKPLSEECFPLKLKAMLHTGTNTISVQAWNARICVLYNSYT